MVLINTYLSFYLVLGFCILYAIYDLFYHGGDWCSGQHSGSEQFRLVLCMHFVYIYVYILHIIHIYSYRVSDWYLDATDNRTLVH